MLCNNCAGDEANDQKRRRNLFLGAITALDLHGDLGAAQTKIIEDILAPMGARAGAGRERSKIFALQLQRHREGLTKSFTPDDKPDRRLLMKLGEFNRARLAGYSRLPRMRSA